MRLTGRASIRCPNRETGFLTLIGDLLPGSRKHGTPVGSDGRSLSQIKRGNDQFIERFMDASRRAQGKRSPVRREDPKSENRYV